MVNQKKRWDWKHMLCYKMRIGQCEIAPNDWYEKDAQKGKDWYEKDAQKGKRLN